MDRSEETSFREYQSARDGALALLGVGSPLFVFSVGFLLWNGASEYGWAGWLAYGLGPVTLALGLMMIPFGILAAVRAKRIRPPD